MTSGSTRKRREFIDLRDSWCAVVPQKAFAQAKGRLALPAATRRIVAAAMLRDTVAALEATPAVRRVVVVWDDAGDSGALPETDVLHHLVATGLGLNEAIELGSARARQIVPGAHVVVVPSDLPALEPVELGTFLRRARGHSRAFVADADGIGTTLLSATGDSPLSASYGVGSRDHHRQSGACDLTRDDLPSLRRDVDDLAALEIVVALGRGMHTISSVLGVDALNAPGGGRMNIPAPEGSEFDDDLEGRPGVRASVDVPITLADGVQATARMFAFRGLVDSDEHIALALGPYLAPVGGLPLVRIHSECLTGDVFGSSRCDCGAQLHESLQRIQATGGYLLYLRQEGRGIGLYAKIDAYRLQDQGLDTFEANRALGYADDERDYRVAAEMLLALGVGKLALLTGNPAKTRQLTDLGITVDRVLATGLHSTPTNLRYLQAKTAHGHRFATEPDTAAACFGC